MHRVRRRPSRPVGDFATLAEGLDTDKESRHQYGLQYDFVFPRERRAVVRSVLEVGVFHGGGLRLWERYFPIARITGLDNDPECLRHASERSAVLLADQADEGQLNAVLGTQQFEVIIDDASHVFSATRSTYEALWPRLMPGGWYVIEDLEVSGNVRLYGGDPSLGADSSMSGYIARIANHLMAHDVRRRRTMLPTARVVCGPNIAFLQKG